MTGCDVIAAAGPRTVVSSTKSRSSALSCSTMPPSREPKPVTCERRLSGIRLTDPSDSSSCHVSLHPDVVASPGIKGQIYDQRARSQCTSDRKDSQIFQRPDSQLGANNIGARIASNGRHCSARSARTSRWRTRLKQVALRGGLRGLQCILAGVCATFMGDFRSSLRPAGGRQRQ